MIRADRTRTVHYIRPNANIYTRVFRLVSDFWNTWNHNLLRISVYNFKLVLSLLFICIINNIWCTRSWITSFRNNQKRKQKMYYQKCIEPLRRHSSAHHKIIYIYKQCTANPFYYKTFLNNKIYFIIQYAWLWNSLVVIIFVFYTTYLFFNSCHRKKRTINLILGIDSISLCYTNIHYIVTFN